MLKFSSYTSAQQPKYFDIRLHTSHRNVLIIDGTNNDSNSILLTGHVVFSLPENIAVKKVSLNLIGTYKLDFLETLKVEKNLVANAVKAETCILKCEWDNLFTNAEGKILIGNYGDKIGFGNDGSDLSKATSALNDLLLNNPKTTKPSISKGKPIVLEFSNSIPTGETPFPNHANVSNDQLSFHLPKGNYSLPFKIVLPGNLPDTVEGLQCGSILYRFETKMEGSKHFKVPMIRYKYIRIFRTPIPSDIIVNEDCSIENSWPNKIQYEVRIPRKAVPIGGKTKIHILIIPLCKGLKLGKMSASIQQYFQLKGPKNESFEDEKTVYKCELPQISMDDLNPDRWSLEAKISIPKKLKQCSQDVTIQNDLIKIRHKLILNVNLINDDGHISQVKSKLPIIFYISPMEPIVARDAYIDSNGKVRFKAGKVPLFENEEE
ncbi:hypothetical protein CANARDRAFT_192958, partial [[Candida] arabinofermentans NRRL YB-2248]